MARSVPPSTARPPIRDATPEDAAAIAGIYNDAVATTVATFDTEPRSLDAQRAWLRDHTPPWVVRVVESEGRVIGWASLGPWSERRAYAATAEVSVYVATDRRAQGWGGALLSDLLAAGDAAGFHAYLARVADGNEASLRLHRRRGFVPIGVMREVGWKFDRWIDVHLLERVTPRRPAPGSANDPSPRAPVNRSARRKSSG